MFLIFTKAGNTQTLPPKLQFARSGIKPPFSVSKQFALLQPSRNVKGCIQERKSFGDLPANHISLAEYGDPFQAILSYENCGHRHTFEALLPHREHTNSTSCVHYLSPNCEGREGIYLLQHLGRWAHQSPFSHISFRKMREKTSPTYGWILQSSRIQKVSKIAYRAEYS